MVSTALTLAPVVVDGWLGEQKASDRGESLEVVDVVREVRDERHGRRPRANTHGLDVAALALGDLVEVREVPVARLEPVPRRACLGVLGAELPERGGSG